MWCSREGFVTEVRQIGEHDWRLRDELKPVPQFTWQQRLLHRVEDCAESVAKSLLTAAKKACKAAAETAQKAVQATKKAAKNSWRENSPKIGVRLAGVTLAGLVVVTNVSERLGG